MGREFISRGRLRSVKIRKLRFALDFVLDSLDVIRIIRYPNHLIAPISEYEAVLVLNPTNPAEYAYDGGPLYYTRLNVHSSMGFDHYPIRGALRLSGESGHTDLTTSPLTDADFYNIGLSVESTKHTIPRRLQAEWIARIVTLGIDASQDGFYYRLRDVTADQFRSLPSFNIIIQSEDGINQTQIGQIEPHDYLVFSAESNSYLFNLRGSVDSVRLHRNVTGNLLIHFDYEHNRIGFADPLDEL